MNGALTTTLAVGSKGCTVGGSCAYTPVTAAGGATPLAYAVSPTLPAGMTLSGTTAAISGTPTAVAAQATDTVTVTDAAGARSNKTFTLTVYNRPIIVLSPATKAFAAVAQIADDPPLDTVLVSNGANLSTLADLQLAAPAYWPGEPTGWLRATLTGGTQQARVELTASKGSLTAGTSYHARLVVQSPTAAPSADTIDVTFSVHEVNSLISRAAQHLLRGTPLTAPEIRYVLGLASRPLGETLRVGDLVALLRHAGQQVDARTMQELMRRAGDPRTRRED